MGQIRYVQYRPHQWLPEAEDTCESICFPLGKPETACREWQRSGIQKASLICSACSERPLDLSHPLRLIPQAMPTGHICTARCFDCSMGTGSRCRGVELSALRKGTAHKPAAKKIVTPLTPEAVVKTVANGTAALKAGLWKKHKRLLRTVSVEND